MPLGQAMCSVTRGVRSAPFRPLFSIRAGSPQSVQNMKLRGGKQQMSFPHERVRTPPVRRQTLTCAAGPRQSRADAAGPRWPASCVYYHLPSPPRWSAARRPSSRCSRGPSPPPDPRGGRSGCQSQCCGGRGQRPRRCGTQTHARFSDLIMRVQTSGDDGMSFITVCWFISLCFNIGVYFKREDTPTGAERRLVIGHNRRGVF